MVWFQCEDCGENLKKPKLPNHFRNCSASKLSCIDCGEIFGQQSVQGHTQCITEAEKYGPKGQGKALKTGTAKPTDKAKQKPEIDVNVGLSKFPPWFCSLCNTKTTSKQTLLLHAEGKKHRAKARAFHAAQQPKEAEESTPNAKAKVSPEINIKDESLVNTDKVESKDQNSPNIAEPKDQNSPKVVPAQNNSEAENGSLLSSKKRKLEGPKNDGEKPGGHMSSELGNGEVIQVERAEKGNAKFQVKKAKHSVTEEKLVECTREDAKKKIKWKKLVKSALKSNPDNMLKMRKLRKLVLKDLRESGFTEEESELNDALEHKINSSSRFTVEGKYVCLTAKS